MTMNLLTGKAGTPHVTSDDMGAIQAGLVGHGDYLLQSADGTWPTITMKDANTVSVPVMNLVLEGRYARVTAAESVKVASGMTGVKRNDLLCIKYARDSKNIETAALVVLQGEATADTPADPAIPAGSILGGSSEAYAPIARITIDGLTPGTPVMLLTELPPLADVWDSMTVSSSKQGSVPYSGSKITYRKRGGIVFINEQVSFTSGFKAVHQQVNELVPDGFRPASTGIITGLSNGGDASLYIAVGSNGVMTLNGTASTGRWISLNGCWIAAA